MTRIESHDVVRICKYCRSGHIVRRGTRRNKSGVVQLMKCNACGLTFSANFGFRYRQFDPAVISEAPHLYYSGMSTRGISGLFETRGIDVDNSVIYRWVERYSKIAGLFTDSLTPDVGNWYRADEVWVKVNGKKHYLFATMDDDTRYWLAGELADSNDKHDAYDIFKTTKDHAGGKNPTVLISDKLPAYQKAARKVFGSKTYHKSDAGIRSKRTGPNGGSTGNHHTSNNKMERLNGTIRDREKTFRGLGVSDTPVVTGTKVHYNHVRRHDSIKKTPAEAAGISTEGRSKWKTIIQNSGLYLIATNQRIPQR
ncbi:MAG: DDE-type integrase/transposase/recombinase [Thaumarchaeota archaeon]|nr:DDE-type integrase/transposase/recombinase [Nitrososphaerota archaeon]